MLIASELSDEAKWSLLQNANFLISPSALESFSLVLFEAWAAGIPVLVNANCETTRSHAAEAEGGLWYRNYPEFEVAVERLTADGAMRDHMATKGKLYTEANYGWDTLIHRFKEFCEHVA